MASFVKTGGNQSVIIGRRPHDISPGGRVFLDGDAVIKAKTHEADASKAAQRIADLELLITLLREEIASLQARLGANSVSSGSTLTATENAEQHPTAELLRFLLWHLEAARPLSRRAIGHRRWSSSMKNAPSLEG